MLFIVSDVELRAFPADEAGAGVEIAIDRAPGVKCERCWRYVPAVSSDPSRPGICDRCQDALPEAAA
jgi:isoleucyl-tRNA synthetase